MFCEFLNHFTEEITKNDFDSVSIKLDNLKDWELVVLRKRLEVFANLITYKMSHRLKMAEFLNTVEETPTKNPEEN